MNWEMEAYVCMKDVSSECLAETDEEALFDANHLYDRPFPLFFRSDIYVYLIRICLCVIF